MTPETSISTLKETPAISNLLQAWSGLRDDVIAEALTLQAIPAPTFAESARAEAVRDRFMQIGLQDIEIDATGNVYARTPGSKADRPGVMVSAHLDTVFPEDTDLSVTHDIENKQLTGPGLGDNSMGLAAMLQLAEKMRSRAITPDADIWWVATVGEEGLGDLRGMREAATRLSDDIGVGIVLEGIGLGRIFSAGLGVKRLRVTVEGPGGHSWLHAERPSAVHHLLRTGAALVEGIRFQQTPRTTFNIGVIKGGTTINTRAAQASMALDMRSTEADALAALEREVRALIAGTIRAEELKLTVDVVGDRPRAALADDHPLVLAAETALRVAGVDAHEPDIGSTDANILLAASIPCVCVGITTGNNAHTVMETIALEPIPQGMRQITLLTLAAAENVEAWQAWRHKV